MKFDGGPTLAALTRKSRSILSVGMHRWSCQRQQNKHVQLKRTSVSLLCRHVAVADVPPVQNRCRPYNTAP